jgi:hypothetical protein
MGVSCEAQENALVVEDLEALKGGELHGGGRPMQCVVGGHDEQVDGPLVIKVGHLLSEQAGAIWAKDELVGGISELLVWELILLVQDARVRDLEPGVLNGGSADDGVDGLVPGGDAQRARAPGADASGVRDGPGAVVWSGFSDHTRAGLVPRLDAEDPGARLAAELNLGRERAPVLSRFNGGQPEPVERREPWERMHGAAGSGARQRYGQGGEHLAHAAHAALGRLVEELRNLLAVTRDAQEAAPVLGQMTKLPAVMAALPPRIAVVAKQLGQLVEPGPSARGDAWHVLNNKYRRWLIRPRFQRDPDARKASSEMSWYSGVSDRASDKQPENATQGGELINTSGLTGLNARSSCGLIVARSA